MKFSREAFAKMILEHPDAEILFLVAEDAPYNELDYSIIEQGSVYVAHELACWVEDYWYRSLITKGIDDTNENLIMEKYDELISRSGVSTKEIDEEIWEEAEEIVSEYQWFEAILVYIEGP